jgi:hypothetical protein
VNRLTAILLAVALVVGAVFVRNKINTHKTESSAVLRLTCSTELEATCNALRDRDKRIVVKIESPGLTADHVAPLGSGVDPGFDAWLTLGPWSAMAMVAVSPSSLNSLTLGLSTPLGVAIRADRAALLAAQCGGGMSWDCLRNVAAKGHWASLTGGAGLSGDIRFGLPDPATESLGLLFVDAAAESHQPDLSSTDLSSDAFLSWNSPLETAIDVTPDPLGTLVSTHISPDIAATARAIATPVLAGASSKPLLTYPSPVMTGELFVEVADTKAGAILRTNLMSPATGAFLRSRGWDAVGPNPHRSDAGLLLALRRVWERRQP